MNSINCVICQKGIDVRRDMTIDFYPCHCYVHANCLPSQNDIAYGDDDCPQCKQSSPLQPLVQSIAEPVAPGEDWVTTPPPAPGVLRSMYARVADTLVTDDRDVNHPRRLLQQHKPLKWIIQEKKWGLSHLVAMGVTLQDFLDNNYSLDELCVFQDIGGPATTPQRKQRALVRLGVDPDMLIDYQHLLPIETLRRDFALTPACISAISFNGGLGFHPIEGLRTPASAQWTLDNVIYLGYTYDDLLRCGLRYQEQWDELEPTQDHMTALHVTDDDIAALSVRDVAHVVNRERQKKHEYKKSTAPVVVVATPPLPPVIKKSSGLRRETKRK